MIEPKWRRTFADYGQKGAHKSIPRHFTDLRYGALTLPDSGHKRHAAVNKKMTNVKKLLALYGQLGIYGLIYAMSRRCQVGCLRGLSLRAFGIRNLVLSRIAVCLDGFENCGLIELVLKF